MPFWKMEGKKTKGVVEGMGEVKGKEVTVLVYAVLEKGTG
jgi:hypothetical protein